MSWKVCTPRLALSIPFLLESAIFCIAFFTSSPVSILAKLINTFSFFGTEVIPSGLIPCVSFAPLDSLYCKLEKSNSFLTGANSAFCVALAISLSCFKKSSTTRAFLIAFTPLTRPSVRTPNPKPSAAFLSLPSSSLSFSSAAK